MREPRWSRAVYTQSPGVKAVEGSKVIFATAAVQCWRGTTEELCSPAAELLLAAGGASATQRAVITLASGVHIQRRSAAALAAALKDIPLDDLLSLRFEVSNSDGFSGVLVARNKLPGMIVEVSDTDRARVTGVAEMTFQRMMIGYVDRLTGWR